MHVDVEDCSYRLALERIEKIHHQSFGRVGSKGGNALALTLAQCHLTDMEYLL